MNAVARLVHSRRDEKWPASARSRAALKTDGVSLRHAWTTSYKNARSAKANAGRIASKIRFRYASSSNALMGRTSASSDRRYRPVATRTMSPSRLNLVRANVIAERLASGSAAIISRAETSRSALVTYSKTRCITLLRSFMQNITPLEWRLPKDSLCTPRPSPCQRAMVDDVTA
jgi:hypothetical protein